ncbi:ABC transporter ATP-binding protein [Pararhodobacter oceanensis]|uniref:Dipeptide ABC transporter ATP-binding protein DppD n=1 Tax=Pararhodobacter oceanensis TaxID=2172121 RepID=A0A2T8HWP0_9RHOB|nr:ABC transporter ATP-binding protein [Pararhodobacter oceanensis]PVH29847.1 dipeptide ABC transporter ATP-binding protein DppD [Pararhodobacter oceanensis]
MPVERNIVLEVDNLQTHFSTDEGVVRAVDGVSFQLEAGKTLALVGESGSGKSVTSLSIMRLLQKGVGRVAGGRILFEGRDLAALTEPEMRRVRGKDIAMVFQEPMTSLTPVYTVGDQIAEAIMAHEPISKRAARARAVELLETVGIPEPATRARAYPHQLSGGMRQRVMIAIALACNPKVLIADEPTTGLDVTIQAQILDLMRRLQKETGMAILFITHDLGVVAEMADRVLVMYAGRTVEEAAVEPLFGEPRMPYTQGLMASIPRLGSAPEGVSHPRLQAIRGNIPSPRNLPQGCAFHPRCEHASPDFCTHNVPALEDSGMGHMVRCARWRDVLQTAQVAP